MLPVPSVIVYVSLTRLAWAYVGNVLWKLPVLPENVTLSSSTM